jgi:tRNA (guanine-N7-)-methyltransferase
LTLKKEILSYVIRQGRFSDAQKKAITELWDIYGLKTNKKIKIKNIFQNKNPLWVEIGFGNGENLFFMAKNNPDINFIGFEVYLPGVGVLLQQLKKQPLQNIKIIKENAAQVLKDNFKDNSVDKLLLLFPDPWHKKRHRKRRFVNKHNINTIANKLKPVAHWHIATDWQDYNEHCLQLLKTDIRWQQINSSCKIHDKPSYRLETKFEKRGKRLGHKIFNLTFELKNLI